MTLCRKNECDFIRISGVGEKKLHEFGEIFIAEIAAHLQDNTQQSFEDDSLSTPPPSRRSIGDSARETMRQFRSGKPVEQIARDRAVTTSTIQGHIAEAIELGEPVDLDRLVSPDEQKQIAATFDRIGFAALSPIHEALGGVIDYGKLRIVRAAMNAGLSTTSDTPSTLQGHRL